MIRDPIGSILRGDVRIVGLGQWTMAAFRETYPAAFDDVCLEVNGFASWPAAPWDVVKDAFLRAETDGVVSADWEAAFDVAEAVVYPLGKMAETLQFVRAAVNALHGYADRARAPGLAREARLLASSIAHAFATAGDDDETIAEGVEQWRLRLASTGPS